jgi:hypothetical protein
VLPTGGKNICPTLDCLECHPYVKSVPVSSPDRSGTYSSRIAISTTITNCELSRVREELGDGVNEECLYLLTKVEANRRNWYALNLVSHK